MEQDEAIWDILEGSLLMAWRWRVRGSEMLCFESLGGDPRMCPWGSREVGWERAAHGGCVREQAPLWAARAWSPSGRLGLYMGHAL